MFGEIIKYKDLLIMLTFRDIRIKYKQAVMGILWALFMPIIAVSAGILIKKAISIVSGQPMDMAGVVSISVKVLPWTFFISAIRFSVGSLVGNKKLVTKIYFPREVLPLASLLASLFDFVIAGLALSLLLAVAGIGGSIYLLYVPLILFFLVLFTAGLGLMLACGNVFFRDIKYIVEIILTFGIFFTPVFYSADTFGDYQSLLLINPVGSILEALDAVVVSRSAPNLFWLAYAGISSALVFLAGYHVFNKNEPRFAENI